MPELDLVRALERMWLIRAFEERVMELYFQKQLAGLIHLSLGQEAVAVGAAEATQPADYFYGGHRSHGHFLGKGADPDRLMAELAGRATGYCKGKGGSMHLVAKECRAMTATGVVGGTIPLALGTALVCKQRGDGEVVAVFFGDGAANTGGFHESINIAALWKLPVILICENNGYAEFTPASEHTLVDRVSKHGAVYDIPGAIVDGNDVRAVHQAMSKAADRARAGEGPTFVECLTYRLRGHYVGDPASYRKAEELAEWVEKDPIRRVAALLQQNVISGIEDRARDRVDQAVKFAMASPFPDPEDVVTDVVASA